MGYWLAFFFGCLYVMIGMEAFSRLDPSGDWDEFLMGEDHNPVRFGLALLSWPAIAFMMWLYNLDPPEGS